MLRTSEIFHLMHRAKEFGLSASGIGFDLDAVVKRSRGIAKQLNSGVGHLLKKNKVPVIMGEAKLAGKGKVSVRPPRGRRRSGAERDPGDGRAGARAAGAGGRRQAGLDLQDRVDAAAHAEAAAW
jgi:hypothetical protein